MFATLFYYLLMTLLVLFLAAFTLTICVIVWYKLTYEFVNSVCTSKARLDGKVAIVTGGNSGIGLEVARSLASRGACVVIACRDERKATAAIQDIATTTGNNNVQFMRLDLADFSSVRRFVTTFESTFNQLHILVNNAGCAGLKHKQTVNGIDVVLQVNYFGHFLLTNLLLPKLIASKPSRIVIVSSIMYALGKLNLKDLGCVDNESQFMKYSNSKMCDILWTKALAKRLPEGVTVNTLHPGAVKTDIFNKLWPIARKIVHFFLDLMFKTPVEGAQTVIHLCVSEEVENISGKYFVECKEARCVRRADDEEMMEKVWEKSVVMTQS